MNIRPATTDDLEAIARMRNACWPDYPVTAQNLLQRDSFEKRERFVLELDGEIRAHAMLENAGQKGNKFELDVLPAHQSRGLGKAFFAWLELHLNEHSEWTSFVSESHPFSLRFAQARGFLETRRSWHSHFDVAAFDESSSVRPEPLGYELICYADYSDPERLYRLHLEVRRDIPGSDDADPSLTTFTERYLSVPTSVFIAVYQNEWVAYTTHRQRSLDRPLEWHIALTATKREHRARGLAQALKLRAIHAAKAHGVLEIHTNNDSTNAAMLEVNRKLGYVRGAAVIQMKRTS
jgi:GNAT superfamily N-acetyltransferase